MTFLNKKYLLKRHLPIVPDPSFRIRILYTHFSHIIKAALFSLMNFSVVNTERARLPAFITYPIFHRHSLTTKVSIIPYPACLSTLTLPYPTNGKYTTIPWVYLASLSHPTTFRHTLFYLNPPLTTLTHSYCSILPQW